MAPVASLSVGGRDHRAGAVQRGGLTERERTATGLGSADAEAAAVQATHATLYIGNNQLMGLVAAIEGAGDGVTVARRGARNPISFAYETVAESY
jgi:hypothetical protein